MRFARRIGLARGPDKKLSRQNLVRAISSRSGSITNGLQRLESEMKEFYGMRRSMKSSIMPSKSLSVKLQRAIQMKWPWLSGSHLTSFDPIDLYLNWLDIDLYLVYDWDLPALAPKLIPLAALEPDIKLIQRNQSIDGTIWIEVFTKSQDYAGAHQADGSRQIDYYQDERSVLRVKCITPGQLLRLGARSSLLFYYTQTFSQLASLYFVLQQLLDSAKLIEPAHLEQAGSNGVGLRETKQGRLLSRYVLALMLAAYLFKVREQRSSEGKPEAKLSLTDSLIGFLQTFSGPLAGLSKPLCVRSAASGSSPADLELAERTEVGPKLQPGEADSRLVILDPITSKEEGLVSLKSALSPQMERQNLILPDTPIEEIGTFFAKLLAKLHSADCNLADLFIQGCQAGEAERQERAEGAAGDLGDEAEREPLTGSGSADRDWQRGQREPARLSRKLLRNILYLALFALVRIAVINYLEGLRGDIEDQARNDFAQLRRQLLSPLEQPARQTGSESWSPEAGRDGHLKADRQVMESLAQVLMLRLMESQGVQTGGDDVNMAKLMSLLAELADEVEHEDPDELEALEALLRLELAEPEMAHNEPDEPHGNGGAIEVDL